MSIVRLVIKNFMSIADVELKPGRVNQIVGKNNQGKTTILKALEWAIKGGGDKSIIRHGEDQAEVLVELPDATTVRRRITAQGNQTVDVRRDGFKAPSPQAFLNGMVSDSCFNPIKVLSAPKERAKAILEAVDVRVTREQLATRLKMKPEEMPPVDFSQHGLKVIDEVQKYFHQRRYEANRVRDEKKKRWEVNKANLPKVELPDDQEPRSVIEDEIRSKSLARKDLEATIHEITLERQAAARLEDDLSALGDELCSLEANEARIDDDFEAKREDLRKRFEQAMAKIDSDWKAARADNAARIEVTRKRFDELTAKKPAAPRSLEPFEKELAKLDQEIRDAEMRLKDRDLQDSQRKQFDMVALMEQEYLEANTIAMSLDWRVEALRSQIRRELMAEAEMPIEGLEYRDGDFLVDGCPVENLSSSKAMSLAIGVARKLAKSTKIICIDGAEMLDEETFAAFMKETDGDGFTYFVTKVGEPFIGVDKALSADQTIVMVNGKPVSGPEQAQVSINEAATDRRT